MTESFNSLRMHASDQGEHISGAERLVADADIEDVGLALIRRAGTHSRGRASKIVLTVERVATDQIRRARLLPVSTHEVADWQEGRRTASSLLVGLGLPSAVVRLALETIAAGAAGNGQVMRGAMLLDVATGNRLEPDRQRGVRVSRMDIAPGQRELIGTDLRDLRLANERVVEALVLASKVCLYPEVIAELCWSDDPDYQVGYVASAAQGYQRITRLKAKDDRLGGRVLFVRDVADPSTLINKLQQEPVLFATS